jgi:putative membrane protein
MTIWEPEIENARSSVGADAIEFQDRRVSGGCFGAHGLRHATVRGYRSLRNRAVPTKSRDFAELSTALESVNEGNEMTATITLAFLHHAAAFLVFAALMAELVLLRGEPTISSARSVLRMDALYGVAAAVVLVAGLLRVFYTEKGADYYFASGTFLAKLSLFIVVGLLSVYPTLKFLGWRSALRAQRLPALDAGMLRSVRTIVHVEVALLVVILLLAPMMAREIWFLG